MNNFTIGDMYTIIVSSIAIILGIVSLIKMTNKK